MAHSVEQIFVSIAISQITDFIHCENVPIPTEDGQTE